MHCPKEMIQKETMILRQAKQELNEYLLGKRKEFTVPIAFSGITISYKYLAEQLKRPNVSRAVGGVVHRNPLPIILPCHRVVGSSESLTGYVFGNDMKKWLLELECRESKLNE